MMTLFNRILSIFDFRLRDSKKLHEITQQSDAQAIQSDWDAVGNDFRSILGHYE